MRRHTTGHLVMALAIVACVAITVHAENGVTDTEILLGQTCALDGPAKALGTGMQTGLLTYFSKVNDQGGINGRKVRLVSKDDGSFGCPCFR